jgi:signal transduction histidine kinase
MKVPQFYITVGLGAICLILSIASILITKSSQNLQTQFQAQQEELNKGDLSLKVGQNLLREMAELSLKNPKISEVLKANGYTVNANPSATPAK